MKIQKQIKEEIVAICNSFNNDPCNLINVLHQVQNKISDFPVFLSKNSLAEFAPAGANKI